MLSQTQVKTLRQNLLGWFQKHKRPLPFREQKTAYGVWLSEIMAQQTVMAAVLPYYTRFIKRFPTLQSVATAPEDELLHLWQGLGYYNRIRNFQKAARVVVDDYQGQIPQTAPELKKLPGVGDYTAAAIASICFDESVAVVDGNVKRVLSRILRFDEDPNTTAAQKFFQTNAQSWIASETPGDFNEAMMELGATLCTPKKPQCLICPLQKLCLSFGKDPESLPLKKSQSFIETHYSSLLMVSDKKVVLRSPQSDSLIRNMWEIPSIFEPHESGLKALKKRFWPALPVKKVKELGMVRHGITNKKIFNHVYQTSASPHDLTKLRGGDFKLVDQEQALCLTLNTLSKKILKKHAGWSL